MDVYLCGSKTKNKKKMETQISDGLTMPEKFTDFEVNLYKRQENIDKQIVGGKLLLWSDHKEVTFVQNAPRGARSVEIGRTAHARLVRLTNGHYSVRLRFSADERQVNYQLIAEMREINKMAAEDKQKQNEKQKKEVGK